MTIKKRYYPPMHTAEHILNQTMVRLFDCERSFSNHIEKKKSKCDYKFPRGLTKKEEENIENKVNEIIARNLDISENFISKADAEIKYNLSRLPVDAGENFRIVRIGDYDECLCIGDHVKKTSEIGRFKLVSTSHENDVLRIRFKLQ
ncbi:MAG: hypothetical protein ACEPOZ_16950 [Marinifilaceae bacterium]|jgi:Ser-tRNA(Ala) deacylase AlaX